MTKNSILALCILAAALGWVLGIVTGAICSLVVAGGLFVARAFGGPLGAVPTWQILMIPVQTNCHNVVTLVHSRLDVTSREQRQDVDIKEERVVPRGRIELPTP